jgi:hypothetical protein
MNICHLSSVLSRYDTRISLKECRSLARTGYQVSLVVADGKGEEVRDGISILECPAWLSVSFSHLAFFKRYRFGFLENLRP